jgi:3-hydroxyanthranilate 3,4-dioxygenase
MAVHMPIAYIEQVARQIEERGGKVQALWQEPDSLVFVARGREYRSEFHINPSSEVMYMIKGDLALHYREPDGKEQIAHLKEGGALYLPPLVPHSPRFSPDSIQLVVERKRQPGEIDRFQWFCLKCDHFLHEEQFVVGDYNKDPVSNAYRNFYDSEVFRTCKKCGTILPDDWD